MDASESDEPPSTTLLEEVLVDFGPDRSIELTLTGDQYLLEAIWRAADATVAASPVSDNEYASGVDAQALLLGERLGRSMLEDEGVVLDFPRPDRLLAAGKQQTDSHKLIQLLTSLQAVGIVISARI